MSAQLEKKNEQGGGEKKVETIDKRTGAGGKEQEVKNVQVVHQPNKAPKTSGGILSGAAASAATTLEHAKEAISAYNNPSTPK